MKPIAIHLAEKLEDLPSDGHWTLINNAADELRRLQAEVERLITTTPAPAPAPVPLTDDVVQKIISKLDYNHALAYRNIRDALEIVMRWIDDYCETGPENDFERVEKIANAAMEYTPPTTQPAVQEQLL